MRRFVLPGIHMVETNSHNCRLTAACTLCIYTCTHIHTRLHVYMRIHHFKFSFSGFPGDILPNQFL